MLGDARQAVPHLLLMIPRHLQWVATPFVFHQSVGLCIAEPDHRHLVHLMQSLVFADQHSKLLEIEDSFLEHLPFFHAFKLDQT